MEGFTPHQFASFLVLQVTENFKNTLAQNGGLFLGRLLEAQGRFIASRKRYGKKAKFRVQPYLEPAIARFYGVIFCQIFMYVKEEYPASKLQGEMVANIVFKMSIELFEAVRKETAASLTT